MKKIIFIAIFFQIILSQCPDGQLEDDCGDCWQSYCYCLSDHIPNFDISQSDCEETGCWWIGPGGDYEPGDYEFCLFDPYWNASCTGCMEPEASNYDAEAIIECDDNCNGETGDCCEYLNNHEFLIINKLAIKNVYPNPFNPSTKISVNIPNSDIIKIDIYDISGKLVDTIYDGYILQGNYTFIWNAKQHQSGIYIVKLLMSQTSDSYFINLIK
tara:strand:+ start:123 stop:764 length:642 start_codon:yes stop_codon:yes gene_type:complete